MPSRTNSLPNLKALYVARTKPQPAWRRRSAMRPPRRDDDHRSVERQRRGSGCDSHRLGRDRGAQSDQRRHRRRRPVHITLKTPLQKAHAAGEDVKEVTVYDYGAPEKGGVDLVASGQVNDVHGRDAADAAHEREGLHQPRGGFTLPYLTTHTFALSVGMPLSSSAAPAPRPARSSSSRTATSSAPRRTSASSRSATLVDGTDRRVELWGCTMDYTRARCSCSAARRPA
jgi:hypothetical protein